MDNNKQDVVAGEPLPESKERYYLGVMKWPSVRVQRLARPEPEREYEPYGDEWRKELMKCPKSMLIDILKTVCMRNRSLFGPSIAKNQ